MRRAVAAFGAALLIAAACSDASESTNGSSAQSASSSGGGLMTPPESCSQPGQVGNEEGVGEYCTPLGKQCDDNKSAQFCLADVGELAGNQWMCSKLGCKTGADCGSGAGCEIDKSGSACLPCTCRPMAVGCPGAAGGGGTGGAGGG